MLQRVWQTRYVVHIWWFCPLLTGFWFRVFGLLHSLYLYIGKPKLTWLHCPIQDLFSYQQKLALYLFIAAKQVIARAWKKPSVPFAMVKTEEHFTRAYD